MFIQSTRFLPSNFHCQAGSPKKLDTKRGAKKLSDKPGTTPVFTSREMNELTATHLWYLHPWELKPIVYPAYQRGRAL